MARIQGLIFSWIADFYQECVEEGKETVSWLWGESGTTSKIKKFRFIFNCPRLPKQSF